MNDIWTRLTHTPESTSLKRFAAEKLSVSDYWREMSDTYVAHKIGNPTWGDTIERERPLPDLLYTMDEHDLGEIE